MSACPGKTVKTTCPYCGVGCGVLATKMPDGSVDIKGDPDHPANFGRLCSKGSALGETLSLEGRLLYPEIDNKRADWDMALDLVAQKFSATIHEHGPDSVAFYVSGQILTEDYYIANKLMKGFIGSANIDTNSRLCMASSVAGHKKAFGSDTVPGTYQDLELADLIVLVGSNLAWCHPVLYQRIEAAKQERPEMKIVLIDPRKTMTANLADMFLGIKPDGDTALFASLLVYLSKHGCLDGEYIENHTNGFEETLALAARSSDVEIEYQTGLSLQEIEAFYELFRNHERVVTIYSQGVNQSSCGTDKVSAIINCHLATGRIGRPGMGPFSVTGQPNAMGGREVGGLANMLACHMDIENESHRALVQEFWNAPSIARKPGLKAVDMFNAVKDGSIKAIWIMSTNPVDSMPEADTVAAALEACPFVVVSDIIADTDTIQYAHVKLPASGWGEKSGTVTNSERRISRQRPFLETPEETKPDWWQMAEVGKRMGFEDAFDYTNVQEIFDEYAQLSALENNGARDFDIGSLANLSLEDYDKLEPVQWPVTNGFEKQEKRFFADGGYFTPDRKARFIAVEPQAETVTTDEHPFVLNSGRIRDHWHTMTRTARASRLSSHLAEPFCEINPEDAVKLGIREAGLIKLGNDHGNITVRALITSRVKQDSLFVPMHWTNVFASNARVDTLVTSRLDPFSGQPALKNVAVSAKAVDAAQYGFLVSREKPAFKNFKTLYWATAKCDGGWRTELAFASVEDAENFAKALRKNSGDLLNYEDARTGSIRMAGFEKNRLAFALYLSDEPVLLSREWLISQFGLTFGSRVEKNSVLAGRGFAGTPDKGAIVCSCMSVGVNQISQAIQLGHTTLTQIGETTTAGTNCGSCRAEIQGIIDGFVHETKIAAE